MFFSSAAKTYKGKAAVINSRINMSFIMVPSHEVPLCQTDTEGTRSSFFEASSKNVLSSLPVSAPVAKTRKNINVKTKPLIFFSNFIASSGCRSVSVYATF